MEAFSWGKFFSGLVDPTAYFKTIAIVLRLALVVLIVWGVYLGGCLLHDKLTPKKPNPVTFTVSDQVGGNVKNSADQKQTKFGLFNF